jgi:hypothetical protein
VREIESCMHLCPIVEDRGIMRGGAGALVHTLAARLQVARACAYTWVAFVQLARARVYTSAALIVCGTYGKVKPGAILLEREGEGIGGRAWGENRPTIAH